MADIDDRKATLVAQLATQRTHLSQSARCVKESLRVGRRIKSSFTEHRLMWLAGAVFAGLALSWFRPRKSRRSKVVAETPRDSPRRGLAWLVIKLIFDVARPTLASLLTARFANFANGRAAPQRSPQR
jgi:hypothetical protein